MFAAPIPTIDSDGFSRCEERSQMTVDRKNLSPGQKTDMQTKESVYDALWEDDVLRALEYHEIDVHVKNGIVSLNGHIVSVTSLRRIESVIRFLPNIVGVQNNLVLDDKLTLEVAGSLGELEHKYSCKFFTGSSHGVISLSGIVRDENVKLLAERCVAGNLNVRGVLNHVRVLGVEPALQSRPFLQPVTGAIIYFLDGIFGIVKQVVINPDNRRVTLVVIQGQLLGQKQNLQSLTNNQAEILQKTVVISVNLIRYLTENSGFLTIKSTETTHYKDFDPLYFSFPPIDWVPPYPYCSDDILLAVNIQKTEAQIMIAPDLEQLTASAQPTSPAGLEAPVDILAAWEDDGGQIIQTAEVVAS